MQKFVKPSKAVTDGEKLALSLEAAAIEISPDVGRGFDEALAPWVWKGETPPSPEEQRQILLARWLKHVRERMVEADEVHQASVRLERLFRLQRDAGVEELDTKIRIIRSSFEKVYGQGLTAVVIGVASDIPEDPVVLQRYARRIVRVMLDPELRLPEPMVTGNAINRYALVDDLEKPLKVVEEAIGRLEPQKRKTQIALKEKQEAIEAYRYARGRIARYLEAVAFLGGTDFHGQRVRQSSHVQPEAPEEAEEVEAAEEPIPPEDSPAPEGVEAQEELELPVELELVKEPEADAEPATSTEAENRPIAQE